MSNDFEKVEQLYHQALSRPEAERDQFLKSACGGDEALRREVENLLAYQRKAGQFMDTPALDVAARMLARNKDRELVGNQLGPYEVLSLLGKGGMGEVYLARDTRLDRKVALKVLPVELMGNPERMKRFVQEAKAASRLNHPNIITIHETDRVEGLDFLVMEYVAGKSLDALIPRKGMALKKALPIAIQIADALAAAHAAGIVHRDLKPGNVMVTKSGQVKVLDFGLAKLVEVSKISELEPTETLQVPSSSLTEEGMIVGTVAYMSPEQAEGKKLDARSDIFSFGSLLYEMVTGRQAFKGDSNASTVAAILKEEPKPASQFAESLPKELERVIVRCLRKDLERRIRDMGDVKLALEELKEETDSGMLAGTVAPRSAFHARRIWLWGTAALLVVAIAVVGWLFRGGPRKPAAAPEVVPLTSYIGAELSPSFSLDGNQVAFSWNGEKQDNFDIFLKVIGSQNSVRLTTDPADDLSPAFSPDGRSIGFIRVSKERAVFIVIPAIGGPERIVAEVPTPNMDVSFPRFAWFPSGNWVVTDGLAILSTETGETRSLTSPPMKSLPDFCPSISPDGRTIAFGRATSIEFSDIYLLNLTDDLKPKEEPRRLCSLRQNLFGSVWTPNGKEIIFSVGNIFSNSKLWRIPASGAGEPERLAFAGEGAYRPAISRSGNRLAYERWNINANTWRLSLSAPGVTSAPAEKFISSTRAELAPQYSPDGKRIAFESWRTGVHGIWICNADGSNQEELFARAGASAGTPRWSPDSQRIAFDFDPEGNTDVYVIRASGGNPTRLTNDAVRDQTPSWSRDGNWIYFASERSGRWETWKVPAGGGEAVRVTRNGGGTAFESPDGQSVYYMLLGKNDFSGSLWKTPVSGGEERQVLPSVAYHAFSVVNQGIYFIPEPGSDGKYSIQFLSFATGKVKTIAPMTRPPVEGLSVSPDGRFLLFSQGDESGSDLMLVENFR